jgi:Cu/Ag efflux protein CusF
VFRSANLTWAQYNGHPPDELGSFREDLRCSKELSALAAPHELESSRSQLMDPPAAKLVTEPVKRISISLAAIVLAFGLGCSPKKAPEGEKTCPMTGEIKALDEKNQTATIQHDAICDWMGAMTMEYPVQSKDEFAQLKVGDKITATVNIKGMDYGITAVHKQAAPK